MIAACCLASVLGVAVFAVWSASRMAGRWAALAAAVAIAGWLALTFFLSTRGVFADFSRTPPRLARFIALTAVVTITLALSPIGRRFVAAVPLPWAVGYQSFRILVELMLWRLARGGMLPEQMTFTGRNFDLLTGVAALAFALFMSRDQPPLLLLRLWAIVGLGLLVNVVVIANLSFPTPYEVFTPPFKLVANSVLIWLPTFLVPAALFGHIALLRWRLFAKA